MNRIEHDSPSAIREALGAMGIALKKRWGQNFLINPGARRKILDALGASRGDTVWEIGPGLGAMTGPLLSCGARVIVFEIDRGLCRHLREDFGGNERFTLVEGDFLKTWENASAEVFPSRILGNLPYRSASLMIASLAESRLRADTMVFTVQKELGDRITAVPGTKAYSAFSVLCQAGFEVLDHGNLRPGSFYPAPVVESSIVEMRPRTTGAADTRLLSSLTRMFFSSRRKTIRNNILATGLTEGPDRPEGFSRELILDAMRGEGIDPGKRAEELAPGDYIRLSERLARLKGS